MKYRDIIKSSEKVYKVKCSFFKEPIYFYIWDSVIAFMKKNVGFDCTITYVNRSEIPGIGAMYIANDLDAETYNFDTYSDSSYTVMHYNELIPKL